MTFVCPVGRCSYAELMFGAAVVGDMFQKEIDKMLKELPNVFGIADDFLIVGYDCDGTDHNRTVCWDYKYVKKKT